MVPVKNKMRNGIIGGSLGGLLGGAAFQQILFTLSDPTLGRALALTALGLAVGLFVSLVEETAKEAWLLLKTGPLAGKQFIVYEDRTVIGSNYAADIALVKDPALKPFHAAITRLGSEYMISPAASDAYVLLNGRQIRQSNIDNGDTIQMGRSELVFFLRSGK